MNSGRIPERCDSTKLAANDELKLLALVLVELKLLDPLVPVDEVVMPPAESMFLRYPSAPEVVNETVAEDTFVLQLTESEYPADML